MRAFSANDTYAECYTVLPAPLADGGKKLLALDFPTLAQNCANRNCPRTKLREAA